MHHYDLHLVARMLVHNMFQHSLDKFRLEAYSSILHLYNNYKPAYFWHHFPNSRRHIYKSLKLLQDLYIDFHQNMQQFYFLV